MEGKGAVSRTLIIITCLAGSQRLLVPMMMHACKKEEGREGLTVVHLDASQEISSFLASDLCCLAVVVAA